MTGPTDTNPATPDGSLARALQHGADLTDGLALPADLRPVAYSRVLDVLLGRPAPARVGVPGPRPEAGSSARTKEPDSRRGDGPHAADWAGAYRRSGLPADVWERLVERHPDGRVELLVAKSRLSGASKAATREVAWLVRAARQGLGLDDHTTLDPVRAELRRYGRYSPGHFREYVNALDDVVALRPTDGAYRLLPDGWAAVRDIAERLLDTA